jgi:hypothetical protein
VVPNPDSCYFFEDEKDSSYRVYRLFNSPTSPKFGCLTGIILCLKFHDVV